MTSVDILTEDLVLEGLTEELRAEAAKATPREVRHLVDSYYQMQLHRQRSASQERSVEKEGDSPVLNNHINRQTKTLEAQMKRLLQGYAEGSPLGQWALSIMGIGPVIAAGLMAHIDIDQAPTVGHIWRFAGLDPTQTWNKSEKRPWNAKLKVLCWKAGDSFVKVSNNPKDIYGKIYRERKALEIKRNERGDFAATAKATLESKKFKDDDGKTKKAYEAGKLPDGRIDARARRYAVKIFLAHYHHVAYELAHGTPPPKPYVITNLDHAHYIAPPNWPL